VGDVGKGGYDARIAVPRFIPTTDLEVSSPAGWGFFCRMCTIAVVFFRGLKVLVLGEKNKL